MIICSSYGRNIFLQRNKLLAASRREDITALFERDLCGFAITKRRLGSFLALLPGILLRCNLAI
ncbi:hypothetical protein [Nostoc sp. TCL240-02]|uniref:hypothetical protein n=1 Tax=Nostoc sp. TCL240-02 TaxID=2572090 RepID=UPI00157FAC5E|nr:hypothetical protein [Nostoc sp. TCL240-02]QKQ77291.1 hypothetical protein FBB35_31910 [Nostoc sp. TCL240-02]